MNRKRAKFKQRRQEPEVEVVDLELARLLKERIEGRRAGQRGTPIEQVARELGFGYLVDGGPAREPETE